VFSGPAIATFVHVRDASLYVSRCTISPLPVETVYQGELFPPVYYASAFWNDDGNSVIRFYRIDAGGTPVKEGTTPVSATNAFDVRLAPLGVSGVIQSVRDDDGDNEIELTVYEAARKSDNTVAADLVVRHSAEAAMSPDICSVPSTHAEGDYVVASTTPSAATCGCGRTAPAIGRSREGALPSHVTSRRGTEVGDIGCFDDPDGLQLDLGASDVVEEPGAVTEHDGNDVELQLVDQARCQVLLDEVCAAAE
jgi:hypothetical protein